MNRHETMTASDRLAAAIRDQILAGELTSGDRLPPESEVSASYQVSRSTAREALRTLAGQGLLQIRRGVTGGAFVTPPDTDQLVDPLQAGIRLLAATNEVSTESLAQIRELLEVPAIELAALRRTDAELVAMRSALTDSVGGTNPCVGHGLHTAMVKATHNPLLEIFAEVVFRVLGEGFFPTPLPQAVRNDIDRDHREIMTYIELRDQAGAREAGRAHLRYLSGIYVDVAS